MSIRLTPRLCRAGRSFLAWEQADLHEASGVSKSTIGAFERRDETASLTTMNNRALVEAFERAGLEFIPENGGGAGIRFRERKASVASNSGTS
ncbi:XRE family transcriptional regulator [Methylobacterium sp. BTF04]|uniref:XRE family transcriptional regulator n=1 Tax=Methylobacterium sp. BTF04 TaxID=2708300 RepID=UPI0013D553D1|nr:XRE family transcriptional regulator [Methylobacterium sp. BTF04]